MDVLCKSIWAPVDAYVDSYSKSQSHRNIDLFSMADVA
jgi:hypothetical protein